jgi:VWFA-related protein
VRVDAYPTREGQPVHGLTAADFEVREDGVLQKIESFEYVVVPTGPGTTALTDPGSQREMSQAAANPRARLVVVFLDPAHVSLSGSHAIKEPIIHLINRVLGPDDLAGLMTPEMSASHVVLGRKTQAIEELLRRNWDWGQASDIPRLNERETMYTMCYPPGPNEGLISRLAAEMISKSRERRTLEALQDLVRYLGAIREERKAIVAVSQGWRLQGPSPEMTNLRRDTEPIPGREPITVGSTGQPVLGDRRDTAGVSKSECDSDRMRLAQMDNLRSFRDLLDDSNRSNTSFYPLDPGGLVAPRGAGALNTGPVGHLRELAENTDGLAIVNTNDLSKGVQRVADDLTSYYLLGYTSTNPKPDGRFRRIQVRVRQPGVQVRARRGYRAATPGEVVTPAKAAVEPPSLLDDAMAALSRARDDARFRINAAHLVDDDLLTVWIAGELPASAGAADEFSAGATADLEIQAGDRSTSARVVLEPGERGFVTSVTLPAAAELNIRARLSGEGSTSPVTDALRAEISPRTARPLVFRKGPPTGNRMQPTADLRFTRGERIRVELPIAGDVKPGAARLLDRRGTALRVPIHVGEKIDSETGQRWITGELALAPLAAGDYAIEQAPDGMQKVITAIRITR